MIEGPDERYQIVTSAFHCILSGSLNEAAYNTYSAGVMEIRIAGSSCRRPQLLFDQFFFHTRSNAPFFYLSDDNQYIRKNKEAVNSTRNTIYSIKVLLPTL